jgi:L-lactate dehydrogenase complex protein LldF
VCPVKINLHNLLLLNRQQSVAEGHVDKQEKMFFRVWETAMKHKSWVNMVPTGLKNYGLRLILKDTWSKKREPLTVPAKTFKDLWNEHQKQKNF